LSDFDYANQSLANLRIPINDGHKDAWAKEGHDVWVRRLLSEGYVNEGGAHHAGVPGVRPGNDSFNSTYYLTGIHRGEGTSVLHVDRGMPGGPRLRENQVVLPTTRIETLAAWARMKVFGLNDQRDNCINIVVVAHDNSGFLLQQKDGKHPNEKCNFKFCTFGGGIGEGESHREAALRELYEEIKDVRVVDEMTAQMQLQASRQLDSVQWGDGTWTYNSNWAICRAKDADQFERWRAAVLATDADGNSIGVAESDPRYLSAEAFDGMHREEEDKAGAHFVSKVNQLMLITRRQSILN